MGGERPQQQRDDEQREAGDGERRRAPPDPVGDLHDDGQEDQLPARVGRREEAHHQPAVAGEPAVGDDRAEDEGERPGADTDQDAPEQHQLPGLGHQHGEPGAAGDEQEGAGRDPAHREPVHQDGGERRDQAVDDQVDRDGAGQGRPAPPELLLQRPEERPGRGPESRRRDEREQGDRGDEPGAVDRPAGGPTGQRAVQVGAFEFRTGPGSGRRRPQRCPVSRSMMRKSTAKSAKAAMP